MPTYRIPAVNLGRLEAEIATLNKRAKKVGAEPVAFSVVAWETEPVTDADGLPEPPYFRKWATVEVAGVTPKLAGWRFVAKLEPTPAGNLLKAVPGAGDIPVRFRTSAPTCDHCKRVRYRTEVFVVAHDDGRYAQVGRQCLADFLGGDSPERLARMAEYLAAAEGLMGEAGGDGWGGSVLLAEPIEVFLAVTAAVVRLHGWSPRSNPAARPTADRVWSICFDPKAAAEEAKRGFAVEPRDTRLAEAALAWAKAVEPTNDYLHNLRTAATLPTVDHRAAGIVASIVGAYVRDVEKREVARKRAEANKALRHVGTPGTRETFADLTVAAVYHFDSDYGTFHVIKLLDSDGNNLVWKTSRFPDWAEEGQRVTVKATVKAHDDYRGTPQTVLSRVAAA